MLYATYATCASERVRKVARADSVCRSLWSHMKRGKASGASRELVMLEEKWGREIKDSGLACCLFSS